MKLTAMLFIPALLVTASSSSIAAPVEVRVSAPLGGDLYGQVVLNHDDYRRERVREYRSQAIYVEPLIIYAPIAHQRHWQHWCGHYGACGQSVRFIEVREAYGDDYDRRDNRHRHHRRHHEHHHH